MISRFAPWLTGLVVCAAALPLHAQTSALGSASALSAKSQAEAAGPNQLFPPLPSLASLPPSAAEQVEEAAPVTTGRRGKKGRRFAQHKVVETSVVRMVVSDESHAYLADVDRKLDDALRNEPRDAHVTANAVSVAMTR